MCPGRSSEYSSVGIHLPVCANRRQYSEILVILVLDIVPFTVFLLLGKATTVVLPCTSDQIFLLPLCSFTLRYRRWLLKSLDKFYTICSIYLPPCAPVERLDPDALKDDLPSPFLLLGDFNGRHSLWDDGATNPCGVLLASFIEDEGLEVLNSGNVTHFHSQSGTFTYVDLFLCTSNSLLDFSSRVLPDLYGSDNFPILLETTASTPVSAMASG